MCTRCSRKAEAESQREALQPICAESSTQMGPPRAEMAVQASGCTDLQHLEVPPEGCGGYHSSKCAQLQQLFKQVAMLGGGAQQAVQYLRTRVGDR